MSQFQVVAETSENTVITEYTPEKRRSTSYQSEAELEKECIRMLCEEGYEYLSIHEEKDLVANLRKQLEALNQYHFSDREWDDFFHHVLANPNEHAKEKTEKIQEDNVQILKRDDGSTKNITLIDKKQIHNNRLQVIHQYENGKENGASYDNRYDVTILVNGLPLVHLELKRRGGEDPRGIQSDQSVSEGFVLGRGRALRVCTDFRDFQWDEYEVLFEQYALQCGEGE